MFCKSRYSVGVEDRPEAVEQQEQECSPLPVSTSPSGGQSARWRKAPCSGFGPESVNVFVWPWNPLSCVGGLLACLASLAVV